MKKLQLGTSHFKIYHKVTVGKYMSVKQQSCLLENPTSFQKAVGLNPIKTERFFLSPDRVKAQH